MCQTRIDIRKITLYKEFRDDLEVGSRKKVTWQVFGYYDSMEISQIASDGTKHMLETIFEDSRTESLDSNGIEKKHIIYAMGIDENYKKHQVFWSNEYPIILVSLVQLCHPIDGDVSELIKSFSDTANNHIKGKKVEFSLYMSMDCNDIIVFWAGNSIQEAMTIISNVSLDLYDKISQVFTIQASRKALMSKENEPLLNAWKASENQFDHVCVYINGKSYKQMLNKSQELVNAYNRKHEGTESKAKYELIPGQEDIMLDFVNIPLMSFIDLYSNYEVGGVYSIGDSRTVIYVHNEPSQSYLEETNKPLEHVAHNLVKKLVKVKKELFAKINGTEEGNEHNNTVVLPVWFQPLMELLIELSNLEASPTAYDIYKQEILCHKTFVEGLLVELKREIKKIPSDKTQTSLRLPDDLTEYIQRYLNGWSQLSFHAMHAQWQLTQTADINRLYLFPAKLSRLYCAFMRECSRVLNANANHEPSVFFLTPSIIDKAEFISVFRPCGKAGLLIHGEISADHMFMPQILLPILVHEAAHYSGQQIRNRKLRYDCILQSIMAALVSCCLKTEQPPAEFPVGEQSSEGTSDETNLFFDLVEILCHNFPVPKKQNAGESKQVSYYSLDIRSHILGEVKHQLTNTPFFLNGPIRDCLFKHPKYKGYTSVQSLLHINVMLNPEEYYINAMNENPGYLSISTYFEELLTVYQEAFSDICMIKLLNLELADYLNIIHCGNRYSPNMTEGDIKSLNDIVRCERYLACIKAAWSDGIERLQEVSDNESASNGVRGLAERLINIEADPDVNRRNYIEYARVKLALYLGTVINDINKLCVNESRPDELQSVYKALAVDLHNPNTDALSCLKPCIEMMSTKPDNPKKGRIRKFKLKARSI